MSFPRPLVFTLLMLSACTGRAPVPLGGVDAARTRGDAEPTDAPVEPDATSPADDAEAPLVARAPDAAPEAPADAAALCGNGVIEAPEACDDGNDRPGDGCSGSCQVELGGPCSVGGEPCTVRIVCGDGKVTGDEECDDGNLQNGDGCSVTCRREPVFPCPRPGAPCVPFGTCDGGITDARCRAICGDGVRDPGEECDDGVNSGAWGTCRPDCTLAGHCGDGLRNGPEQCDLGAMNEVAPYGRDRGREGLELANAEGMLAAWSGPSLPRTCSCSRRWPPPRRREPPSRWHTPTTRPRSASGPTCRRTTASSPRRTGSRGRPAWW